MNSPLINDFSCNCTLFGAKTFFESKKVKQNERQHSNKQKPKKSQKIWFKKCFIRWKTKFKIKNSRKYLTPISNWFQRKKKCVSFEPNLNIIVSN